MREREQELSTISKNSKEKSYGPTAASLLHFLRDVENVFIIFASPFPSFFITTRQILVSYHGNKLYFSLCLISNYVGPFHRCAKLPTVGGHLTRIKGVCFLSAISLQRRPKINFRFQFLIIL